MAFKECGKKRILVSEACVNGADGDPGSLRDVGQRNLLEEAFAQEFLGRGKNVL